MKIAICDDEQVLLKKLHDILWTQPDCSINVFLSPLELLSKYKDGIFYDVIFLDIVMKPINGIELASEIRQYDKNTIIIFLTAYAEYAPCGYEVRAFRYLLKPIKEEAVLQVMQDVYKNLREHKKILLRTSECEFLLNLDDIQYIEANNKECTIHCQRDMLTLRKGLTELEAQFPADTFARIHRKYFVNLSHVREFDESHLTLDCNITLPISRRKSHEFRYLLQRYIEKGLYK